MMDMEETRLQLEFLVGAMSILSHINWVEFSLLRSPNILWARPQDAYTLIKHFEKAGNKPHSKPKEFLHHLRAGVLFGEPSAPVKQALIDAYGFESFDCYATTEFPCLFVECSAHAGLHVWMDICISEIIPSHELDKEQTDPLYKPKAIFLSNAEPGIKGEYVVTTFSQAFPLVRYRTEDLVRVVSTKKCQCGLTHPRIEVLGKINKE
jgi:phenylacetate-coenzyme A ligase PaaK-like adenylate-forming protein